MADVTRVDFTIYQGADWSQPVLWLNDSDSSPVDTSGFSFRMQIRRKYADAETSGGTLAEPLLRMSNSDPPEPLPEDSPLYGQIIVGGPGEITLTIPGEVTDLLPRGSWVYDVEAESPGSVVTRLCKETHMEATLSEVPREVLELRAMVHALLTAGLCVSRPESPGVTRTT